MAKRKITLNHEEKMEIYYKNLSKKIRQNWAQSSPERKKCLIEARSTRWSTENEMFYCSSCLVDFPKSSIHVDHKIAICKTVHLKNLDDAVDFLRALESKELQVLCKKCHKIKTKNDVKEKKKG